MARASRPSSRCRRGAATLVAALLPPLVAGAQNPLDEEPDWLPSVGIGFGISSQDTTGTITNVDANGSLFGGYRTNLSEQSGSNNVKGLIGCFNFSNPLDPICYLNRTESVELDGATIPFTAQLLGPRWESVPGRPRPLLQGGFVLGMEDREIVEIGPSSRDMLFLPTGAQAQIPALQTTLSSELKQFWFIGLGTAIELPIELRRTWLKLSVNYSQQTIDTVGNVLQPFADPGASDAEGNPTDRLNSSKTSRLTVGEIGPGIGIESLVFRAGPIAVGFSADVFAFFPISGTDTSFQVEGPVIKSTEPNSSGFAEFSYDASETHWYGSISVRVTWMGR